MTFKTLDDLTNIDSRRVLTRVDLNVPMEDGRVKDATRIERITPTITELSNRGAKVILLAHFGRPKDERVGKMSLEPIAEVASEVFGKPVAFAADCIGDAAGMAIDQMQAGDILLLENTRFHAGEEGNDAQFSAQLASLGDICVNDAFSAAHRAHASTEGIAHHLQSYAGRAMQAELEALEKGLGKPDHPVIALVGGAKVSTKFDLLANLVEKIDHLVVGGGMANTFLAALGLGVGNSICEQDLADTALKIMARAADANCEIVLPSDVVVAEALEAGSPSQTVPVDQVPSEMMILDAGEETIETIGERIRNARTLVWNGPLGAFEIEPFDKATVLCAQEAARATQKGGLVSVAGGGDTVAALNHAGVTGDFSYVSTAGGAFLEWMEGKTLPGVAALESD